MTAQASIVAAEAACALGSSLEECEASLRGVRSGLRPLGELLGSKSSFASLPGGWISERGLLEGRRYGAASNLAVRMARGAAQKAGWTEAETESAWIFAGTSRGNAVELLGASRRKRPVRQFRASNTMHAEVAAAVSIELGIRGPWQVLSNGCSSGLDALGFACQAVASGLAPRALALAVDLPLDEALLQDFYAAQLLSLNGTNDPFSPDTAGFLPGEGAAAVAVESAGARNAICRVGGYAANSDAHHTLALPADGAPLADLLKPALKELGDRGALCPHATGTAAHAIAEAAALRSAWGDRIDPLSLVLLKPYTGHCLGASGLLDVALLAPFLARGELPANLPSCTTPHGPFTLGPRSGPVRSIVKTASSLGGHNARISLFARD